ncbi:MAG: hypothetical protein V7L11_26670 [Nostoc sp.]|uniref:hypothetical protein n=1 Tax=Nostoc sp. TaxID=1180 RepID=UPI002FF6983E
MSISFAAENLVNQQEPFCFMIPDSADFEHQTGRVHLVGNLTLNYVKVRCIADIELASLERKGHLQPVES